MSPLIVTRSFLPPSITVGSLFTQGNGQTVNEVHLDVLDSGRAIIGYRVGNTVYAVVASISGSTVSFGTEINVTTLTTTRGPVVSTVDTDEAVYAYSSDSGGDGAGQRPIYARPLTISGTTISSGSQIEVTSSDNRTDMSGRENLKMKKLDTGIAVLAWRDNDSPTLGTAVQMVQQSGLSLSSYGSPITFTGQNATDNQSSLGVMDSGKILVGYEDGSTDYHIRLVTRSGTSLTDADTLFFWDRSVENRVVQFADIVGMSSTEALVVFATKDVSTLDNYLTAAKVTESASTLSLSADGDLKQTGTNNDPLIVRGVAATPGSSTDILSVSNFPGSNDINIYKSDGSVTPPVLTDEETSGPGFASTRSAAITPLTSTKFLVVFASTPSQGVGAQVVETA